MLIRKTLIACTVAGAALLGSAIALAQTPPSAGGPPDRDDMRRQMATRMCAEAPAHAAGRIAYAEVKLAITDAQRAAWQTFTAEAKAAMQPMLKLCETAQAPPNAQPADAGAELSRRERYLQARLDSTKAMRMAIEKLQPALTDKQKTELAQLVRRSGMGGRGPGGGHEHHHRMPGHGMAPQGGPPATPR